MKKMSLLFEKDPKNRHQVIDKINKENEWVLKKGIPTRKWDGSACLIKNGILYKRYDAKLKQGKQLKELNYYIDLLKEGLLVVKISGKPFSNGESIDRIEKFISNSDNKNQKAALLSNCQDVIDIRQIRPTNMEYDKKYYKQIPDNAIPCQEEPDHITGHWPHWIKCNKNNPQDKYHFEAFDVLNNLNNIQDGTYELCGPKINSNHEKLDHHILIPHGKHVLTNLTNFSFESVKNYLKDKDIEGIVFHNFDMGKMCKIRKTDFGFQR